MRSSFNVHILNIYIIYGTYNIYIYIYLCIAYISSHSKGPEQDQLRSPFVPYVRNTAERSIHNFDSWPYIYIYMGASQNRRSGTSSGTTPVPYPRSIPLFHTSDPYVIIYININYIIVIYICKNIYIYIWLCAIWFYICTHIYERTYIHECIHARIRLLCPSPVIVLVSLCLQHLQLLPTLLCDGREVLGCCQLAV